MRYWTTDDLPAGEQFSYWREVICEAFAPLSAQRKSAHIASGPPEPGLTSWVRSTPLTSTNCAEVSSRTQLIAHGQAEVQRTDSEQVFVNLQLTGHCVASQGGRTCVVQPGNFALFDTTSEYRLEFVEDPRVAEWRCVSFRVPRQNLLPLIADSRGFTAVAHGGRGGLADIVATTMTSIWKNVDGLDRSAADAAETAFTTVLAASVGAADVVRDTGQGTLDVTLRATINRYLAANVRHADLSAAQVAGRFGISLRKLYGLYENTKQTFGQTIMALRVEGCARDLAADSDNRSLTEFAMRWGFCDLSHMNRVFRAQRGCLPSEYRTVATLGLAGRSVKPSTLRSTRALPPE